MSSGSIKAVTVLGFVVLAIGTFICARVCAAPQTIVDVQADPLSIELGDTIDYTVTLTLPAGAEIDRVPAAHNRLGEFMVRDVAHKQEQLENGAQSIRLHYELTVFEPGTHTIPEYEVRYRMADNEQWQTVAGAPVAIKVASVMTDVQDIGLRPLKPKITIWRHYEIWVVLGIVIVLAIAGIFFFRKKLLPPAAENRESTVKPAHRIAYEELEALQRLDLISQGRMEEYFERLSGCLRRYLENRFHLRAPWLSTEEFLITAKTSSALTTPQKALLRDFLLLSDLVKFARYGSSAKEAEDSFLAARNFVDQTKEDERGKK